MFLAIDYGRKKMGLAIGEIIPKGLGIISNDNSVAVLEEIKKICDEYSVDKIILGLPLRDDGGESEMSLEIREFGCTLEENLKKPVVFEQEQYTSEEAKRIIADYAKKNHKYSIDEISAILILEQYLEGVRE